MDTNATSKMHASKSMPPQDQAAASTHVGTAIRLSHAAVTTTQFGPAIDFYVDILGLSLRTVEDDPIREGRRRAMLTDHEGRDVIELIEMPELAHPTIPGRGSLHHLGFCLPRRGWHSLRSRLDAARYPYQEIEGRLFVRDADGLVIEIEQVR